MEKIVNMNPVPTFRRKISDFIIFSAIDFESNVDLLDFYA
jgi:hypothetical protein